MTEPRYHVRNTQHGWTVVRQDGPRPDPDVSAEVFPHMHLGLAETLSEAVLIANEDAGRELKFSWHDDFQAGEGQ